MVGPPVLPAFIYSDRCVTCFELSLLLTLKNSNAPAYNVVYSLLTGKALFTSVLFSVLLRF